MDSKEVIRQMIQLVKKDAGVWEKKRKEKKRKEKKRKENKKKGKKDKTG